MNSIGVVICGTTIVLAYVADPTQAINLLKTGSFTCGLTFIVSKITDTRDGKASDFINMAGYSLAGVAELKLLYLAGQAFKPWLDACNGISSFFGKLGDVIDKITFWN
jgi:hypothetical protein